MPIPALRSRPDAVVVMDDLAAHEAGTAYRHLPSHSPDLDPIEPRWSKLEGRLRTEAARSLDALGAALGPALAATTAQDARGWFRPCGYPAPD